MGAATDLQRGKGEKPWRLMLDDACLLLAHPRHATKAHAVPTLQLLGMSHARIPKTKCSADRTSCHMRKCVAPKWRKAPIRSAPPPPSAHDQTSAYARLGRALRLKPERGPRARHMAFNVKADAGARCVQETFVAAWRSWLLVL